MPSITSGFYAGTLTMVNTSQLTLTPSVESPSEAPWHPTGLLKTRDFPICDTIFICICLKLTNN